MATEGTHGTSDDSIRRTASGAVDGRSTRARRGEPLSETVRQKILASIRSGELAANQVINTGQLAEQYGVSRTPVREALGALERAGLVTVLPYRGYIVRPLSLADVRDIYFVREVIETAAAEQAARLLPEEALDSLEELAREHLDRGATSSVKFDERSYDFHRRIAEGAQSPRLLDALEVIFSDSQRLHLVGSGLASREQIVHDHNEINAALRARDGDAAREAMRTHLRRLFDSIAQSLTQPPRYDG